jgi:hypothetical protein
MGKRELRLSDIGATDLRRSYFIKTCVRSAAILAAFLNLYHVVLPASARTESTGGFEWNGSRAFACPVCDARTIPIIYGLPSFEMEALHARREIALGGCCIGRGDPMST